MAEIAEQMMISDGSGMKQKATVDDLVKMVEDLTRIHWSLIQNVILQIVPMWNTMNFIE